MNQELIKTNNSKSAVVWGSAGLRYEKISHSISDAIENCVNSLDPKPGERILDAATGTGWAARLLAKKGAVVTGIDFSGNFIKAAKDIASEKKLEIEFIEDDAESLSFPDSSFDAVISTFGVMFAGNPESAAAELTRVCKTGGRLALTTWLPDDTVFGMFKVMKPFMAVPAKPLPSPFEWGKEERITELFGSEFDLRFESGISVMREPSSQAVWDLFVNNYGPTLSLASTLDVTGFENLKNDFIKFHDAYNTDSGLVMPRKYLLTTGVRK